MSVQKTVLDPCVSNLRIPEINVMGTLVRTLFTGAQTGNAFSLFQMEADPGLGIPMHVHEKDDETFMILGGRMEVVVDGKTIELGPGDQAFGPRGIPHSWKAIGEERLSFYMLATPGGIENMFGDLSRLSPGADMAAIFDICGRQGIRFV